jgi:hypothetical protein
MPKDGSRFYLYANSAATPNSDIRWKAGGIGKHSIGAFVETLAKEMNRNRDEDPVDCEFDDHAQLQAGLQHPGRLSRQRLLRLEPLRHAAKTRPKT